MTWATVARRQTNLADVHFAHTAQSGHKGTKVRPLEATEKSKPGDLIIGLHAFMLVRETQLFVTPFICNLMQ